MIGKNNKKYLTEFEVSKYFIEAKTNVQNKGKYSYLYPDDTIYTYTYKNHTCTHICTHIFK